MRIKLNKLTCLLVYLAVCGLPAMGPIASGHSAAESGQSLQVQAAGIKLEQSYGQMPLIFIPNKGQMDERVHFAINGKDKSIYFTSEGLTYVLAETPAQKDEDRLKLPRSLRSIEPAEMMADEVRRRWVVKLDFVGSRKDVRPESLEESETVISYFKGRPEDWQADIQASSRIIYRDLWPGIDLVYYGTVNKMKYEFLVQPGADPGQIKLAYSGADRVELNEQGQLEITTPLGAFADDVPVAWQDGANGRMDVPAAYALREVAAQVAEPGSVSSGSRTLSGVNPNTMSHVYGFEVGSYDRSLPLVLDPAVLVFCGYIGGSSYDVAHAIAVDSTGNVYLAGRTNSTEAGFPVHAGPDLTHNGDRDAFLAKVRADGTGLVYCGYIGGWGDDEAFGIAVDSAGNAYVAGWTESNETSFPVLGGPDLNYKGNGDAFVAKVNAAGTALVYCGYIGGSFFDYALAIAVDGAGNAYVAGETNSSETLGFPVIGGPGLNYKGNGDAFAAKVNAAGTALVYCGYIGGSGNDSAEDIAVDGAGNAYLAGVTQSSQHSFPVTIGPDLNYNEGYSDAFVAKVNSSGTALLYCGYIGGSCWDHAYAIAVDGAGNAYVAGGTSSEHNFPVTVGPDPTQNGETDAFVAKLNSSGTALVYCGYIGGSGDDWASGIAVDGAGNAYVAGWTESTETSFPVIVGPDLTYNGGQWDVFVTKVNPTGTSLIYCGYIGGAHTDTAKGIAVDSAGNAYVAGHTNSTQTTFPVTVGPDLTQNGDYDAFVAKVSYSPTSIEPTVTTNAATGITSSSAVLNMSYTMGSYGSVNVRFAHKKSSAAAWTHTDWTTKSAPGDHADAITGLDSDTPYDFKAQLGYNSIVLDGDTLPFTTSSVIAPPAIGLNRTRLNFGAVTGGPKTDNQGIVISNTGGGTLDWTVAGGPGWLGVAPTSGSGTGTVTVSVNPAGLSAGTYTSQVTFTAPGASNSPQAVNVTLNVYPQGSNAAPFGSFDTPANGATVYGAIPVTGWALDDVQVEKVEIKRSPHTTDPAGVIGSDGLVFISNAIFVEGARPDVETAFPQYPLNYRAGWGYMLLTNMLPNQGNDAFTLHAFVQDKEGTRVKLGQKTITGNNTGSAKPFGAIDTPAQGEQISGAVFNQFGWVLTPQPNMIPTDGSTIRVWVDGASLGHPAYNFARPALAALFPGLANTSGPVGLYVLDTTAYASGVHTIAWSAVDSGGNAEGIGSRYFSILNTGGAEIKGAGSGMDQTPGSQDGSIQGGFSGGGALFDRSALDGIVTNMTSPVYVMKGYDMNARPDIVNPELSGAVHIEIAEVERVELLFGAEAMERAVRSGRWSGRGALSQSQTSFDALPGDSRDRGFGGGAQPPISAYAQPDGSMGRGTESMDRGFGPAALSGYLLVGDELRPLPIGSTLDPASGAFAWQPGPGFLGEYKFVFVRECSGGHKEKTLVRITIRPKF